MSLRRHYYGLFLDNMLVASSEGLFDDKIKYVYNSSCHCGIGFWGMRRGGQIFLKK